MKTLTMMPMMVFAAAVVAAQDPQTEYRLWVEQYAAAAQVPPPPPPPPPRGAGAIRVPLESKAVKGAPYSAQMEIESIQTLGDGNRIVHRTTGRVYRDSAGRIRREEDQPSGQPTILLFDPEAGVSYSLDLQQRIAWKTINPMALNVFKKVAEMRQAEVEMLKKVEAAKETGDVETKAKIERLEQTAGARGRGGAIARIGPAKISEETEEGLGTRTMEGVRATGIRRTTTIPAGAIGNELPIKIVSEEWTSPDLQVLVQTSHSDPRIGQSSYRVINISRTEPNPTLFQVPSDFTVKETGIRQRR